MSWLQHASTCFQLHSRRWVPPHHQLLANLNRQGVMTHGLKSPRSFQDFPDAYGVKEEWILQVRVGLSQTLAAHIGMRQTWDPYALAAKLHHQAGGLDLQGPSDWYPSAIRSAKNDVSIIGRPSITFYLLPVSPEYSQSPIILFDSAVMYALVWLVSLHFTSPRTQLVPPDVPSAWTCRPCRFWPGSTWGCWNGIWRWITVGISNRLRRKHQGDIKNGLGARFKCYQRHPMTENERRRISDDVPLPLCFGVFRCTHYRHGETRIKSENRAHAVRRNCERLSPKRGNVSTSPRAIFLKPRSCILCIYASLNDVRF